MEFSDRRGCQLQIKKDKNTEHPSDWSDLPSFPHLRKYLVQRNKSNGIKYKGCLIMKDIKYEPGAAVPTDASYELIHG